MVSRCTACSTASGRATGGRDWSVLARPRTVGALAPTGALARSCRMPHLPRRTTALDPGSADVVPHARLAGQRLALEHHLEQRGVGPAMGRRSTRGGGRLRKRRASNRARSCRGRRAVPGACMGEPRRRMLLWPLPALRRPLTGRPGCWRGRRRGSAATRSPAAGARPPRWDLRQTDRGGHRRGRPWRRRPGRPHWARTDTATPLGALGVDYSIASNLLYLSTLLHTEHWVISSEAVGPGWLASRSACSGHVAGCAAPALCRKCILTGSCAAGTHGSPAATGSTGRPVRESAPVVAAPERTPRARCALWHAVAATPSPPPIAELLYGAGCASSPGVSSGERDPWLTRAIVTPAQAVLRRPSSPSASAACAATWTAPLAAPTVAAAAAPPR